VTGAVNYLTLGRGTNVGEGLQVALRTIVSPEPQDPLTADESVRTLLTAPDRPEESIIILLSDGASTVGPDPLAVAHDLGEMGVRVYTVGLGTDQGVPNAGFGNSRRFEENTLKEIANETGGKYFSARNASQLEDVYDEIATSHELVEKRTELTFLAVAAAALFSVTGAILGSLWGTRLP
jgi:Ca-activated chloride channel family protein